MSAIQTDLTPRKNVGEFKSTQRLAGCRRIQIDTTPRRNVGEFKSTQRLAGMSAIQTDLTLKAFANFSPGLRFDNLGEGLSFLEGATLKELRRLLSAGKPRNPFQGCEQSCRIL